MSKSQQSAPHFTNPSAKNPEQDREIDQDKAQMAEAMATDNLEEGMDAAAKLDDADPTPTDRELEEVSLVADQIAAGKDVRGEDLTKKTEDEIVDEDVKTVLGDDEDDL